MPLLWEKPFCKIFLSRSVINGRKKILKKEIIMLQKFREKIKKRRKRKTSEKKIEGITLQQAIIRKSHIEKHVILCD